MKEGAEVDKAKVTEALKKNKLDLANAEKVVRQKAQREMTFDFAKAPT